MPIAMTSECRKLFAIFVMGAMIFACGCRHGVDTIWKAEVRSPDGQWLARAQTDQRSGFGTDGATTAVYLRPTNGSRQPVEILSFSQNENAQTSLIGLKMKWVNDTHLIVSYNNYATLDFQAIKYAGIDISVQDLPSGPLGSSQ